MELMGATRTLRGYQVVGWTNDDEYGTTLTLCSPGFGAFEVRGLPYPEIVHLREGDEVEIETRDTTGPGMTDTLVTRVWPV